MHGQRLQISQHRIATFKEAKRKVQKVRDEMKDLFEMLFVDDWPRDSDMGAIEEGDSEEAELVPPLLE